MTAVALEKGDISGQVMELDAQWQTVAHVASIAAETGYRHFEAHFAVEAGDFVPAVAAHAAQMEMLGDNLEKTLDTDGYGIAQKVYVSQAPAHIAAVYEATLAFVQKLNGQMASDSSLRSEVSKLLDQAA